MRYKPPFPSTAVSDLPSLHRRILYGRLPVRHPRRLPFPFSPPSLNLTGSHSRCPSVALAPPWIGTRLRRPTHWSRIPTVSFKRSWGSRQPNSIKGLPTTSTNSSPKLNITDGRNSSNKCHLSVFSPRRTAFGCSVGSNTPLVPCWGCTYGRPTSAPLTTTSTSIGSGTTSTFSTPTPHDLHPPLFPLCFRQ